MYTPVTPVSNPVILVRIQQKKSGSDKIRKSIILFYFLFCNLLTPLFLNRLAIQKVQFVKFLKIYNKIVFFFTDMCYFIFIFTSKLPDLAS